MIEYPGRIFFSRWEKPDQDNAWLYQTAYKLCVEARTLFYSQEEFKEDTEDLWTSWQVLELHGIENPRLHIVWYKYFGVHPYPEESRRIVYNREEQILEDWKITDPFLLHYSYKLVPEEPYKGDPLRNPMDRRRWRTVVEDFYSQLEKHSIIYHAGAHQKSSWEYLQRVKKIEILNLPDEDNPTRIDKWKIVEVDPEYGYADFSKL
jgi:hypothetical protein